jgi:hypothetical protein
MNFVMLKLFQHKKNPDLETSSGRDDLDLIGNYLQDAAYKELHIL